MSRVPSGAVRRILVLLGVCAVAVPVALAAIRGAGYTPARIALSGGAAWLPSPGQALVTLIDGPSELVIGSVRVRGAEQDRVVQAGTSALLVDREAGTVTRIDGATYDVSAPVGFSAPVDLVAGPSAAYVIDGRGTASAIDPTTLQVRGEFALGGVPREGQTVVDSGGRLWAVPGVAGGLVGIDPSGVPVRSADADASARLLTVQGRPVLVDVVQGRAGRVGDDAEVESWTCLPVRSAAPQVLGSAGSPRVYVASPDTGAVVVADLRSPDCGPEVPVGRAGDTLGRLVEAQGFVLVPNETTGHAAVVDVEAGEVAADLPVLPDSPGKLELVARDGLVFYNDLAGDRAGVLTVEGRRWAVGPVARKFVLGSQGADPVRLLESGAGEIPPDRPPVDVPPPRAAAGSRAGSGPGGPPVPGVVVPPPPRPPPSSSPPPPPPPPPPTHVVVPDLSDTLNQQLSSVRSSIEGRIRTACGDGTVCLTIGTTIVPTGPTLAIVPPCAISAVSPAGGQSVPRGSAITFSINEPCGTGPTEPVISSSTPPPEPSIVVEPEPEPEPVTTRPRPEPTDEPPVTEEESPEDESSEGESPEEGDG